jgi:hypothetical protein
MKFKKIILSGLIAGLLAFIAGSILYMNPLVSDIYSSNTFIGSKPMDLFGGTMNWLALMMIGGLVSTVFLAFLYSYTEKGIKIKSTWKKGAFFGFLLWLVTTLPASYNAWLMYTIPEILITIELFNGLIGGLVAGITIAILFEKLK